MALLKQKEVREATITAFSSGNRISIRQMLEQVVLVNRKVKCSSDAKKAVSRQTESRRHPFEDKRKTERCRQDRLFGDGPSFCDST